MRWTASTWLPWLAGLLLGSSALVLAVAMVALLQWASTLPPVAVRALEIAPDYLVWLNTAGVVLGLAGLLCVFFGRHTEDPS
jgi:hypothetical protein